MIKITQITNNKFLVTINNVYGGELEPKEDGYFDWYPPEGRRGYIPSYILRTIADKLDELNKDWDKQVQEDAG